MRRWLGALLIIVGIGSIAYPTVRDYYWDKQQEKLMAEWLDMLEEPQPPPAPEPPVEEEPEGPDPAVRQYIVDHMEGILIIDKIKLTIPVLDEDTDWNLNLSVAHISGTPGPGEVGNFGIAGHHMRAYGRHFNRLKEVAVGDTVVFKGPEHTYTYKVFETVVVKPQETWVLDPIGEDKLITLITCDYREKPSVRMVVRGRLQE